MNGLCQESNFKMGRYLKMISANKEIKTNLYNLHYCFKKYEYLYSIIA